VLLMRKYENTERSRVIQVRALIGLLALVAMCIALIKPRVIYTFVLFAWGALGASFTPTILLSLHWKRFNWKGGLACFLAGPLTIVIWKVIPGLSEALYEMIPGVIVSTVAGVAVSIVTSRDTPEDVSEGPS
jgi:Na+/proline symporter